MRKLLAATSSLALVGTWALAHEPAPGWSISGAGELGLEYDSGKPDSDLKHEFAHDMGVKVSYSKSAGTLTFGGTAGFDSKTGGGSNDLGTVYVKGSFGTVTIGDVGAADKAAGAISEVGLNAIGVADLAHTLRGQTGNTFRYDQKFGQVTVAASAGPSGEMPTENEFAVGMQFAAGAMSFGVGYASGANDINTPSLVVHFGSGAISGNLLWSSNSEKKTSAAIITEVTPAYTTLAMDDDSTWYDDTLTVGSTTAPATGTPVPAQIHVVDAEEYSEERTTVGMDMSYSFGDSKLILSYARLDFKNERVRQMGATTLSVAEFAALDTTRDNVISDEEAAAAVAAGTVTTPMQVSRDASHSAFGVGIEHKLGGGATVVAGFGSIPMDSSSGANLLKKNKASVGLKFTF